MAKTQRLGHSKDNDRLGARNDLSSAVENTHDASHLTKHQGLLYAPHITSPYEGREDGDSENSEHSEHSDDSKDSSCHPDWSRVEPWLLSVPEECNPVEEPSIVWPVDEILKSPLRPCTTRDNWPSSPDTSKFSSTDWAKYLLGPDLRRAVSPSEPSR